MSYGTAPLEKIDLRALERIEACPSARGPGSLLPTTALERWKVVRDATVQWHHDGMPYDAEAVRRIEEAFFAGWDQVQRRLLEDLFAAYRRLFPRDASRVELDPVAGTAIHAATNRSITVGVHVDIETESGWQAIRLRTGRRGTSAAESAAFHQPGEERTLADLCLGTDDVTTVTPPPDPVGLVDELALRWDRAQSAPRRGRVAGLHCHSCPRPARCGQYPVVGDRPVTSRTRTLLVSKTRLAAFARCARSAAWPAVYGIPRDDGDEDDYDSSHLVVGNEFHRSVAAALLSDDPGAVYEAAAGAVAPSEVDDLRWLFDQHEALWLSEEPSVTVSRTEYQFGVTFVVEGIGLDRGGRVVEAGVAVSMVATTDVNGWEQDGVAAVVEHRTGTSSSDFPHEADLYAVSAWEALAALGRAVHGVAVHFHHLRADPASCDRRLFTADQIELARQRLADVARRLARLHPLDAMDPSHAVGPWCERCDWLGRCLAFRQSDDRPVS